MLRPNLQIAIKHPVLPPFAHQPAN